MKIVVCIDTLRAGGVQSLVYSLLSEMQKNTTTELTLLILRRLNNQEEMSYLLRFNVPIKFAFPSGRKIIFYRKPVVIYKILKEIGPDLLHCHSPIPHTYAAIAARIMGIKIVLTIHNTILWTKAYDKIKAYLVFRLFLDRITDHYISVCELAKRNFVNSGLTKSEKITCINNATEYAVDKYDQEITKSNIRNEIGIPESATVFVNIAVHDIARKNQLRLLEAFAMMPYSEKEIYLLLVGDGNDRVVIEGAVKSMRIEKYVKLGGFRSDVPNILRGVNFFVLPSLVEGAPIAILEAFSFGVPVIASNVGGIPELVRDGVDGYLVDPHDTMSIYRAMLNAVSLNSNQIEHMRNNVHNKARNDYSPKKLVSEHMRLYDKILCNN